MDNEIRYVRVSSWADMDDAEINLTFGDTQSVKIPGTMRFYGSKYEKWKIETGEPMEMVQVYFLLCVYFKGDEYKLQTSKDAFHTKNFCLLRNLSAVIGILIRILWMIVIVLQRAKYYIYYKFCSARGKGK